MGLPPNCKFDDKVDIYGDLDGQCKRGLKIQFDGRKRFVGTGYLKMLRYELFESGIQPSGIAVHTIMPASKLPVVNETLYPKGEMLLQNLPSIVCGWVVNAQPNEYILDMCAAPGNKTTHLAEMSNDQTRYNASGRKLVSRHVPLGFFRLNADLGTACIPMIESIVGKPAQRLIEISCAFIIALDKTTQKSIKIKNSCDRQGVTCVTVYAYDSTKCCSSESKGINDGPPFPPCSFDKVLLDAPCSGLGQRPQLNNKMTPKILQSYKFVQRKLFSSAVNLLKVGGQLIYSTCTITEEENEGMVVWALEKYPCLQLVPAEPLLGGPGLAIQRFSDDQRVKVQRFGPEIDPLRPSEEIFRDSIGFFIASFIKLY